MSTKNNVKEEVTEVAAEAAEKVVDTVIGEKVDSTNTDLGDMFTDDAFAREKAREDSGVERDDDNTVVYKTSVPLRRHFSGEYANFRVAWNQTLNGLVLPHEVNFVPVQELKRFYDIVNAIFGEGDTVKLDIARTESTRNRVKTITYQARISALDDDGNELFVPLNPDQAGDRSEFKVLIALLKNKGVIK